MADFSSSAPGSTRRSWLRRFTSWVRPQAASAAAPAAVGPLAFRSPSGSQPYVGEIALFAGNFAPDGWLFCDGSCLPISEYETLYQLISSTYGGDGESTFCLPNLCGRAPLHAGRGPGASYQLGEMGGTEETTLTTQQIPNHSHALGVSSSPGTTTSPQGFPAIGGNGSAQYTQSTASLATQPVQTLGGFGGGQPHNNMQPYLAVNYIISLYGVYPQQ